MVKKKISDTPVMVQFNNIKSKYPDTIVLFRMGDFYETFENDALIASKILGIVLTKRSNGKSSNVNLAGFPHHSIDNYLPKLVKAGHRVAICEQVENPKLSKGIVKREVVEIVTPGTIISEQALHQKSNSYIGSLYFKADHVGVSFIDTSTGEFFIGECNQEYLNNLLLKFSPSEIIVSKSTSYKSSKWFGEFRPFVSQIDDWMFDYTNAYKQLIDNFKLKSLKSFGCENFQIGIVSGGALLNHLKVNLSSSVKHISKIQPIIDKGVMVLDGFTIRNLEIFQSLMTQGTHGTLIETLDKTKTAGGGRLLRKWLLFPLTEKEGINKRLKIISAFIENKNILKSISLSLKSVVDIERVLGKISRGKSIPSEVMAMGETLSKIPGWLNDLSSTKDQRFLLLKALFSDSENIVNQIYNTINRPTPNQIKLGNVIQSNINLELDELRAIFNSGKEWISSYEKRIKSELDIPKLKIGFNRIFGYFIEVTKVHTKKIPDSFIRRQTLVNSERYITDDLKSYEAKILNAEEKIFEIETQIFFELCQFILKDIRKIQTNALAISHLDLMCCFSNNAIENNYVKPELSNNCELIIGYGRHPVVEKLIPATDKFIANNLNINSNTNQIHLITGPNMAGKSTYLRQIGLITIMAQIGSFVPAKTAKIGIVDRLFTRVGASDNLSAGESTFMVEMIEAANIINNMTPKSLILLDEIGRGTSTYDGLSIAWAITEHLHNQKIVKPRTLFATHFHELTKLENSLDRLVNYHVEVKEYNNDITFLRSIVKGIGDKSYGIQVAKMAGLPKKLIDRSYEILNYYLKNSNKNNDNINPPLSKQLSIFNRTDSVIENMIKDIELDSTTPLEAMKILNEIKKQLKI